MKTVLKVLCVVFALASVGHLVAGKIWFAGIVLSAVCGYFGFRQKSEASPSEVATGKAVPDPVSQPEPSRPKPVAASRPPQAERSADPTQSLSPSGVFEIVKHASNTLVMKRHEIFKPHPPTTAERIEAVIVTSFMFMKGIRSKQLDRIILPELRDYILHGTDLRETDFARYVQVDQAMPGFLIDRLKLIDKELTEMFRSDGRYMAAAVVYNLYANPLSLESKTIEQMLEEGVHVPPLSMLFQQLIAGLQEQIAEVAPIIEGGLAKETTA